MNSRLNLSSLIICATLLVLLTSCNLPAIRSADTRTETPSPATPNIPAPDGASATPMDQLTVSTPSPTTPPTLVLPSDWVETPTALGLTIAYPPDWEVIPYDDHGIIIREMSGQGWIEINIMDSTNAKNWNLEYTAGMQAQAILNTLLEAAREDGTFEDPHHLLTRDGRTAWFTEGTYDVLGDHLLIGVLGLPDRAILLVGHSATDQAEWQRLSSIYRLMLQSITLEP